jgi:hypothetical protein
MTNPTKPLKDDHQTSRALLLTAGVVLLVHGLSLFAPMVVLGVAIFAAIWAIASSILILRDRQLPRWAGVTGLIAGGLVALPALEVFGITPPVSIVLSTTGIQLWFMALGLLFLWRALRRGSPPPASRPGS